MFIRDADYANLLETINEYKSLVNRSNGMIDGYYARLVKAEKNINVLVKNKNLQDEVCKIQEKIISIQEQEIMYLYGMLRVYEGKIRNS